jgi:hypothetical protein
MPDKPQTVASVSFTTDIADPDAAIASGWS